MDWLILFIFLPLLIPVWRARQQRAASARMEWERSENRPQQLLSSRLYMSEQLIRTRHPVPLSGRVDQVYRLADGDLCIVDTKRRRIPRVYFYDVIQGSVYALILLSKGFTVSPVAFVRQVNGDAVKYLPYRLLAADAVVALYHRYQFLRRHPEASRLARSPGLCKKCGQRRSGRCAGA